MNNKYAWPRKKILIVEDEINNAKLLQFLLEKTKVHLSHVYTGPDAIKFISNNPDTDLILMDINIPEKDGLTVTSEIKETNPDIIVIVQTAYVGMIKQKHIERSGADGIIGKPIDSNILYSEIDKYFSK